MSATLTATKGDQVSRFSHIVDNVPQSVSSAEITIYGLGGMQPVLTCKPANEANAAYFDALLKSQRRGAARRLRNMTAKTMRAWRAEDAALIAEHCVTGWREMIDAAGDEVDFSTDNAKEFFKALLATAPGRQVFDDFRNEIADSATFTEAESDEDVAAMAGN